MLSYFSAHYIFCFVKSSLPLPLWFAKGLYCQYKAILLQKHWTVHLTIRDNFQFCCILTIVSFLCIKKKFSLVSLPLSIFSKLDFYAVCNPKRTVFYSSFQRLFESTHMLMRSVIDTIKTLPNQSSPNAPLCYS